MNLGEKINQYRCEKNLSQDDLAKILDVSKQSISDWENNNVVPELSKLIKMSELFQVTLDVLIKENSTTDTNSHNKTQGIQEELHVTFATRKIAGTILLSLGYITFLMITMKLGISNFVFSCLLSSPLIICGIICFSFKNHLLLWCSWGVFFSIDVYLRFGTGLNWKVIFHTFQWTYSMNYMRLAIGWIQFLVLLILTCITLVKFHNKPYPIQDKTKLSIISSWMIAVLSQITLFLMPIIRMLFHLHSFNFTNMRFTYIFIDWIGIVAFLYALVNTIRYRKKRS